MSYELMQILTLNSCTDAINEPARCGESSAVGGFPAVGGWRTRRGVPPVVATGVASLLLTPNF
ncbi:MAG: hypothetical protein V7K88_22745 [Nostoc sp.]|uniref:hypothetical protein n=1 Tax=Nostoc sp. TaxID=1180 RepID=UPI002FFA29B3